MKPFGPDRQAIDLPVTFQTSPIHCVAACVDMLLPGREVTVVENHRLGRGGMTLADMVMFVDDNYIAVGLKTTRGTVREAIESGHCFLAIVDRGHAVVVEEVRIRRKNPLRRGSRSGSRLLSRTTRLVSGATRRGRFPRTWFPCDLGRIEMNRLEVERRLQKYRQLYERGLLSTAECAESFLFLVADAGIASDSERLLGGLPPEVATQVSNRLLELEAAGYDWTPLMIGGQLSGPELERLREQLRIMHHCVCQQN